LVSAEAPPEAGDSDPRVVRDVSSDWYLYPLTVVCVRAKVWALPDNGNDMRTVATTILAARNVVVKTLRR
jgi:hypothetical protein